MTVAARARGYRLAGEYESALRLFEHRVETGHLPDGEEAFEYARALRAASRYREACDVLLAARLDPSNAVTALAEEAELRWIMGERRAAIDLAICSLQLDPFQKKAQTIRDRARGEIEVREAFAAAEGGEGKRIAHAAFYVGDSGNFGDQSLPVAVRDSVSLASDVGFWMPIHVHQQFDRNNLEIANACDAMIVGGGGLFLPDTAPNGNSGWQWNVPVDALKAIRVPLAVTAVGYNLFKGQEIGRPQFRPSLHALCEKAVYVGLRNHGSIDRVRQFLPADLAEKVVYYPCPTTILSRMIDIPDAYPHPVEDVLLNGAFDRAAKRFEGGYDAFLDQMVLYVEELLRRGRSVAVVAHLAGDEKLAEDLGARMDRRMRIYGLYDWSLERGYAFYRKAGVVVGMRGHGGMIPFGVGTPILSIVSHPKMRFFLEDIGHPEWGVDVADARCGWDLLEKTEDILDRQADYRAAVERAKDGLFAAISERSQALALAMR